MFRHIQEICWYTGSLFIGISAVGSTQGVSCWIFQLDDNSIFGIVVVLPPQL